MFFFSIFYKINKFTIYIAILQKYLYSLLISFFKLLNKIIYQQNNSIIYIAIVTIK